MVVCAVSDLHGVLPEIPPCDLLLMAGDTCPYQNHGLIYQSMWLRHEFRDWLGSLDVKHVVACAGNHDFLFEEVPDLVPRLDWHYLNDSSVEIEGLTIWGSPWTQWFQDMAWNAPMEENPEFSKTGNEDEPFLTEKFGLCPDNADVILVHSPPYGYGDNIGNHHTGSRALLKTIDRVQPKLCVFGHIHQGRGVWQRGQTTLMNATLLDEKYNEVHKPHLFTL